MRVLNHKFFHFIVNDLKPNPHSRITTRLSAPDSDSHTSPGRPRIWRKRALPLLLLNTVNFSVFGSKRSVALAPKSDSQTMCIRR